MLKARMALASSLREDIKPLLVYSEKIKAFRMARTDTVWSPNANGSRINRVGDSGKAGVHTPAQAASSLPRQPSPRGTGDRKDRKDRLFWRNRACFTKQLGLCR
jgi:hypothetical protein